MTDTSTPLDRAANGLREYGLSENTKAWLRLLMALVESVKSELLFAPPEAIAGLQAQARQLKSLQDVVTSTIPVNGRA